MLSLFNMPFFMSFLCFGYIYWLVKIFFTTKVLRFVKKILCLTTMKKPSYF